MLTSQQAAASAKDRFLNAAAEILRGTSTLAEAVERETRADERRLVATTTRAVRAALRELSDLHSAPPMPIRIDDGDQTEELRRLYCPECDQKAPCQTSVAIQEIDDIITGGVVHGVPREASQQQG